MLVVGWGGTYGAIAAAVAGARARAVKVARRTSTTSIRCRATRTTSCGGTAKVLVPEINIGQLALMLRAEYLVDAVWYTRVRGRAARGPEIEEAINAMVER